MGLISIWLQHGFKLLESDSKLAQSDISKRKGIGYSAITQIEFLGHKLYMRIRCMILGTSTHEIQAIA